ncbi:MAG: reprolysin-like metallopeptidase [Neptuniibacter sp.]
MMNKQNFILSVFIASTLGLNAQAEPVGLMNTPQADKIPPHVQLPEGALAGHYFASQIHDLNAQRFSLLLPDNSEINVQKSASRQHPNGSKVWKGSVEGSPDSSVLISQYGTAIAGTIRMEGRVYKIQQVADELHMLIEVSPNEPFPEHEPISADVYTPQGSSSQPATDQASDDGSQIDVMVVYSTATKERYGGVNGVNAYIAQAISESNTSYIKSQINTQLRLVHTAEVRNTFGQGMGYDLSALKNTTDSLIDEVHGWRDQYGADMVSWFNESSDYCGIAYLNKGDLSLDAGWGFSVVYSSCATGYFSTAHELGHNMGSHHDVVTTGGATGVYPYSLGYQNPDGTFRTVMAYNCPGGCVRAQHFSNPNVTYSYESAGSLIDSGLPTGITDQADNARSINQTRVPVSLWRTAVVGTPPNASFDFSCSLLSCNFTDTSTSTNPIVSTEWNFGDDSNSSLQNPAHTYTAAGSYSVQLTITDDTGATDIQVSTVTVTDSNPEPPGAATLDSLLPDYTTTVPISWAAVTNASSYTLEREKLHPKNGKWTSNTLISGVSSPYSDQPGSGTFRYRLVATNEYGSSTSSWVQTSVADGGSSGGGGNGGGNGGGKGRNK